MGKLNKPSERKREKTEESERKRGMVERWKAREVANFRFMTNRLLGSILFIVVADFLSAFGGLSVRLRVR